MNKKDRRHSGRYTPKIIKTKMKYNDMKMEGLEPQENYDEWAERRDGLRDTPYLEWKQKDKKKRNRKNKIKTCFFNISFDEMVGYTFSNPNDSKEIIMEECPKFKTAWDILMEEKQ